MSQINPKTWELEGLGLIDENHNPIPETRHLIETTLVVLRRNKTYFSLELARELAHVARQTQRNHPTFAPEFAHRLFNHMRLFSDKAEDFDRFCEYCFVNVNLRRLFKWQVFDHLCSTKNPAIVSVINSEGRHGYAPSLDGVVVSRDSFRHVVMHRDIDDAVIMSYLRKFAREYTDQVLECIWRRFVDSWPLKSDSLCSYAKSLAVKEIGVLQELDDQFKVSKSEAADMLKFGLSINSRLTIKPSYIAMTQERALVLLGVLGWEFARLVPTVIEFAFKQLV